MDFFAPSSQKMHIRLVSNVFFFHCEKKKTITGCNKNRGEMKINNWTADKVQEFLLNPSMKLFPAGTSSSCLFLYASFCCCRSSLCFWLTHPVRMTCSCLFFRGGVQSRVEVQMLLETQEWTICSNKKRSLPICSLCHLLRALLVQTSCSVWIDF